MRNINKTHVEKYLDLRASIKDKEAELSGLKVLFLDVLKSKDASSISTPSGKISYVRREVSRLDEVKLTQAFGNLDKYKTMTVSESVLVTA